MLAIRYSLFILFLPLLYGCEQPVSHQQRFLQFGTLIDVTVISSAEKALRIFDDIEALLKLRHQQWHGWLDGDLKQFNQKIAQQSGSGIEIPSILRQLIVDSKKYYDLSDGLFNPAMGKLIAAWGFHNQSEPDHETIQRLKYNMPGMHQLKIENERAYADNPDIQLDFGGIAKGLVVKQIAELLNQSKIDDFIINAGGDIYTQGKKPQQQPWRVAIEDPFDEGIISAISIRQDSSIFTSGNYRRFFRNADGTIRHHIIDPRTGEPSRHISSATVIHPDPVLADVAATTLMLTEIDHAKAMANKLNIQQFLIITPQKEIYISREMLQKVDTQLLDSFSVHPL